MRLSWRDALAGVLLVFGGVVTFARLQSYSWWLIGSYKGALGVMAVVGVLILLTNLWEIAHEYDFITFSEIALWIITAAVIIPSLVVTTTRLEFIWSVALIALSWLVQLSHHVWMSTHSASQQHYVKVP